MSGSWFSVCPFLLILLASGNAEIPSNRYFDSDDGCSTCQVPVRPTNILENWDLTEENTTYIYLELRPCNRPGDENEDIYFRLRSFYVDCVSKSGSDIKMDDWEMYGYCDEFCTLEVFFDKYQEFAFQKKFQLNDNIIMDCDTRMKNCTVIWWGCDQWPRETNELRILQITKETLVGKDS